MDHGSCDLLIIDDILPSDFSPFRTIEYGHYLSVFDAQLGSLEGWHPFAGDERFEDAVARLSIAPAARNRIHRFEAIGTTTARLVYVTFLNNAYRLLPFLTERQLPFVFQLYPGDGFSLEQPDVDERLRQVLLSPLCRKVIVTQTVTRDYVLEHIDLDPAKVAFIYGGVFDSRSGFDFDKEKRRFPQHKPTLDLCFVAHKYGADLASKGYDRFVQLARALASRFRHLCFHVVGDYSPGDVLLGEASDRFAFYGRRGSGFFAELYPRMDAIVSMNRPFALAPGAFDGFPTGACIEAGCQGVLNCINDPLGLNVALTDMRDVVLLPDDVESGTEKVAALLAEPATLYQLSHANWRRFQDLFATDRQLSARRRLLAAELSALTNRSKVYNVGFNGRCARRVRTGRTARHRAAPRWRVRPSHPQGSSVAAEAGRRGRRSPCDAGTAREQGPTLVAPRGWNADSRRTSASLLSVAAIRRSRAQRRASCRGFHLGRTAVAPERASMKRELHAAEQVRPPDWAESTLRLCLDVKDHESVTGDLLEEYREVVQPARGSHAADCWYIRQVSGFLWRTVRTWAVLLSGAFVARSAYDWFAPTGDFHVRASVSTAIAAVLLLSTGFAAAWRSSSLLAGPLAALAMSQVAAVISVAGAAVLVSIWHDTQTMRAIAGSGGLSEVFLLPFLMAIPAVPLGVVGGVAGRVARRLVQ